MEHRKDLEEILLSGLPVDEREHVEKVIGEARNSKLARLRAQGAIDAEREKARADRRADEVDSDDEPEQA